jgi:hypothetical protein
MLDAFSEEIALLLVENCPSHIKTDVISLLTEEQVRVMTFAPHINQIFQVFDVNLFYILKRHPRYINWLSATRKRSLHSS